MDHGRDRPRLMLSSRAPNAASRNMGGNMRRSRLAASRVRRPYSLVKQPYTTHRRTFRRLNLRIAAHVGPDIHGTRVPHPRRGDQPFELRIERRRQRHLIDVPPTAVVKLDVFDRVPARDARPAQDSSRAIGEACQVGGLDRRLVRLSFEDAP